MHPKLQLLARPRLVSKKQNLKLSINQTALLFFYLAVQADWVTRDELLALFWPDKREAQARKNLRTLLYKAKQEAYALSLEVENNRVRWLAETDVASFQEAISQADWQNAVTIYKGAFLEDCKANESTAFEDWLEQTRNDLHASWREAVLQVSESFIEQARHKELVALAQKVLLYDDLAEELVVVCMKSQALAGQTAEALKTYKAFKQKLIRELEIEPLESTQDLAISIREGKFQANLAIPQNSPSHIQNQTTPQGALFAAGLPQHLTPFIGRKLELLDLTDLLKESHYRQITLLGPGGIGKSRLATELLKEYASSFKDGAIFVPLAALANAIDIPDALAAALAINLIGSSSVSDEVKAYLANKEMLIVFDSFEHVLEGATLVTELLARTNKLKIICTSRVLLAIPNELVYDVVGLTTPGLGEQNLEAYDATRLFISSARRTRLDFSVESEDYAPLIELCQLLEGMPLAIELASTWVRLLSVPELLKELSTDKDFLEVEGQQLSARHRSMRGVFETSWQLLNPEEQRVLADLSILRGGFDRQASSSIVKASARTLLSLVNKSFLRTDARGRFSIHELIRQYAAEKLGHDRIKLEAAHGNYFLTLLQDLLDTLKSESPRDGLDQIEQNLENIRLAWNWALTTKGFRLCEHAVEPLSVYFISKYRLQEGLSFWHQALDNTDVKAEAKLSCLIRLELGNYYRGLDQYDLALKHLGLGLEKAKLLQDDNAEALITGLTTLANIKARLGAFQDALEAVQEANDLANHQGKEAIILKARAQLAYCLECSGGIAEAKAHYNFVFSEERRKNHPVSLIPALGAYGLFLIEIGEADKAQALFREGLVLVETYGITMQRSFMWEGLGRASFLLGNYNDSLQQSKKALAYSENISDLMGIAVESRDVAKALIALHNFDEARTYLKKALKIIWKAEEIPWIMEVVFVWAQLFLKQNEKNRAYDLLQMVASHESSKFLTKEKAQTQLMTLGVTTDLIESPHLATIVGELLED